MNLRGDQLFGRIKFRRLRPEQDRKLRLAHARRRHELHRH
jgi:hypothetical protein